MSEVTERKPFGRVILSYSNKDKTRIGNPNYIGRELFNPAEAVFTQKIEDTIPELRELINKAEEPIGGEVLKVLDTISINDMAFFTIGENGYISVIDKRINKPVKTYEVELDKNGRITTTIKQEVDANLQIIQPKIEKEKVEEFAINTANVFADLRKHVDTHAFVAELKKHNLIGENGAVELDTLAKAFQFIQAVIKAAESNPDEFIAAFNEKFQTNVKTLAEIKEKFNYFVLTGLKLNDVLKVAFTLEKMKGKTQEEIDNILKDYSEQDRFFLKSLAEALQELMDLSVRKANYIKVAYNANGQIVLFDNKTLNSIGNGEIHSDLGFAELTKEVREAFATIEKYHRKAQDEDCPTLEEAQEAENILRAAIEELTKEDNSLYVEKVVLPTIREADVVSLGGDDHNALKAFQVLFDFYMKKTFKQFIENKKDALYSDEVLLTKPGDDGKRRLRYNSYATLEKYGIDIPEELKDKKIDSYVIVAKLPTIPSYSNDFYLKTKSAIIGNVYMAGDKIVDIKSGTAYSQYLKTYAKLGNVLLGIANLEDPKKAKDYAIELNNIIKFQVRTRDGIKPLENVSNEYKKFIKAIEKPILRTLQKALNDGNIEEAKKIIENAGNAPAKTPVKVLSEFLKAYETYAKTNSIYTNNTIAFALKSKNVVNALKSGKDFEELKESLTKNERKLFGTFKSRFSVLKDAIITTLENDKLKIAEMDGIDEEKKQYLDIESVAKNLSFILNGNVKGKLYYTKTENNQLIINPYLSANGFITGVDNPVEAKTEFGITNYTLNKEVYNTIMQRLDEFTNNNMFILQKKNEETKKLIEQNKAAYANTQGIFGDKALGNKVKVQLGDIAPTEVNINVSEKPQNDIPAEVEELPTQYEVTDADIDIELDNDDNIPQPGEDEDIDILQVAINEKENTQAPNPINSL